jgi:hypothetical protein
LTKQQQKADNPIKCYEEQINETKDIEKYLMMRRIRANQ